PLQHSVSNLPEPAQPGQMISLCSAISILLSVLYSLVPGRWYGGDPAGRRRRPKTARHRSLNLLRHHSRHLACFRRTSTHTPPRRRGFVSRLLSSPIAPGADALSRRSAALL